MAEGTPENKVTYFTVQGHSHDGVNSTKVDFTGYDLFDFISEGDLERLILSVVDSNPLHPKGGIIIEPPDGSGDGVFIGPDVPGPATGLASTCSINEDGATVRTVTWNAIPNATSYIIQLHRSIDTGSNYLKIQEVETNLLSHSFEAAPMASVTQTRYKLIVQGKSGAGITGATQTISDIQPCVDAIPPAGPKFEDAGSPAPPNFFVSFRGFLARLQEQTEADTKWGIGQFEYSVSESLASEGQWIANEADNGRQTGRVLSVTGLATGTPYYLRVRAYDNSNNYSPWTYWNGVGDDGDATMANADSFTPTEITGTEIGVNSITTGHIQANTIVAGDIAAHTITAGEIGANAITADRLETDFALVNHTISSQSYTAGSVGWMIDYGGTAEFNGAVTVRNLTIEGNTTATNPTFESSFEINDGTNIIFKIYPSGDVEGFRNFTIGDWDDSAIAPGLNWNYSTATLSIRGHIQAFSGTIGAWNIDADSIYTGTKDYSGFTTTGMTLYSGGSLHAKNFYINTSGAAYFKTGGTTNTAETGVPKLVISADSVANGGAGNILHSWIQGYTGDAAEDYPGLLIFTEDGSTDGAVYLAAPRFTASLHYSGFKAVHDSSGFGYVTMGVVDKTDTFITTVASATSVTNVLGYGGLTLAQDQTSGGFMPSATNTLYRKGTALWWNGAAVGGSSNTYGTALTETSGTVNHDDYISGGTSGGVGYYIRSLTVNAQGHITAIDTEPESTIAETFYWTVQGDDSSPTNIGPGTETLTISGGTNLSSVRASNQITINHDSGAGSNHIPAGGSAGQFLKYSSSGTAVWAAEGGGVTDHGALSGLSDDDHPQYLKLSGGTMTGTFNVGSGTKKIEGGSGGGIIINSAGNAYLRAGSESAFGVTAWSSGHVNIYNGTAIRIQTGASANVSYVSWIPSSTDFSDLGSGSKWWNYSYHRKMDFSSIPWASGSGYYMWMNTSDQIMHASSSERIKKDIVTIPISESLGRINALRPVEYTPRKDHSDLKIDDMWEYGRFKGFIAEEAAEVDHGYGVYNWWKSNDPESEDYDEKLPSLSSLQQEWTDEEVADYYDLDEARPQMFDLHAILADSVGAIQELSNKLDAAEARLAALEA
jgi:hypothetical protein